MQLLQVFILFRLSLLYTNGAWCLDLVHVMFIYVIFNLCDNIYPWNSYLCDVYMYDHYLCSNMYLCDVYPCDNTSV